MERRGGHKVYALDIILATLQKAGPALDDVSPRRDGRALKNPYVKEDKQLHYVGSGYFGQKRQISVPMVVNSYNGGKFETLFVGAVE